MAFTATGNGFKDGFKDGGSARTPPRLSGSPPAIAIRSILNSDACRPATLRCKPT